MVSRTTGQANEQAAARQASPPEERAAAGAQRPIDHKGLESFAAYVKPVEQCNVMTERFRQQVDSLFQSHG